MENTWETSINELISIYWNALNSILPWLEKAKIPWKEGESYDDYDAIASALYENIVIKSVNAQEKYNGDFSKYNFHYKEYSLKDYIGVEISSKIKMAFVSFQSIHGQNDKVKVALLDESENLVGYDSIDYTKCSFNLSKSAGGKRVADSIITILL